VVGAYCDLELIGDGSMGKVYRARRPDMRDQRVAVKIPKTSDVQSRERFNREIAASATLRHENIVRAFDCGESDGQLYLVMDLEEGQILNDLVREERFLSCRVVGNIICDIAKGLVHAQAHGIVNRDIKPENVLIANNGQAKLLDFGLAIVSGTDGSTDRTTVPGTLLGTVAFMSPEQARDPRDVTTAADVYSLGCTAYYALTGQPPFRGKRDRIVEQHAAAPRPLVSELRSDVPPSLSMQINRMMAISAADRPTAEATVAELSSYLPHLPDEISSPDAEAILDGEFIEEGQALVDDEGMDPPLGELIGDAPGVTSGAPIGKPLVDHGTEVDIDTPTHPLAPTTEIPSWEADLLGNAATDNVVTNNMATPGAAVDDEIADGEAIEEIPLENLVSSESHLNADSLGAGPVATSKPRRAKGKPKNTNSRRKMIAVTLVALLVMGGVAVGTKLLIPTPNPDEVWNEIQEDYQLHKWKHVEERLAEFSEEYPASPHVAEVPFFLAMCDAGRDIFSQTGDAERGLGKVEKVFQDFRDTQEYDNYNSDLFLDLQRLIERFVERSNKTAQPASLASAEKSHELLSTVAQSITEDWVEAKVGELGESIRQAKKQLEVALAKQEILDTLSKAAAAEAFDGSTDRAYEEAKALLQRHPSLVGNEDIDTAFNTAYTAEVAHVTYEPFADDADVTSSTATSSSDETIFVVWDQPSQPVSTTGGEVYLSLADGVLYAFDSTGVHLWSRRLGIDSHRLPVSLKPSPTSPEAVIAISSIDNALIAIASRTGRVLWRYQPEGEQDLAASLTISRWQPAPNKPPRVRGLIPTESGEIHVLELVRGRRMGRFQTNVPMTVGGVFDPVTQLLYFPADSKRVFAIDPAVIEAQDATSSAVRSVLFTNHLSGSLRSKPQVVGQYFLLTELMDLENTQLRAFELQPQSGFAKPDAEPVKQRILHGWSWFAPPLTPDRMTLVTDAGELGVFGLNLDNPDEALYPLIHDGKGNCPTLAIRDPARAMAIHSDEHLLWVMAGGTLRNIALDILDQKIATLWPNDQAAAQVVGMPLHEAAFDRETERIYVATRSPDSSRSEFSSVDATTGERLWTRQLGVHSIGDPVFSNRGAMLVDRSGRILQLTPGQAEDGTNRVNVVADDTLPAVDSAARLMRIRDLAGKEYLIRPSTSGSEIAFRTVDPSLPFQPPWRTVTIPSTRLQGRPAIVDGYLMVPCADGRLHEIPLNGSAARSQNEQPANWAPQNSVAPDDAPAVYPLGTGQILLIARNSLRWLEYVRSDVAGYWKERKEMLIESPIRDTPAFAGDFVFMGSEDRSMYRVRRDGTGDPETWALEGRPTAGPFVNGDLVFVVVDDRTLVAFHEASATPRWRLGPLAGHLVGRPTALGKSLLVTDDSGTITGVRVDTGKVAGVIQLEAGAIPAAAAIPFGRGGILVLLADGTLIRHQTGAKKTSSRPQGVRR